MSTDDALLDLEEVTGPAVQWRLAAVQLANWGTFDGEIHTLPIARRGHLITGPSGSGKSSLLDAIATVLTPDRWLRLNQAAQGAGIRTDQRTIYSYLRGAWSRTVDDAEDRVVSAYLRPRATWSGIVLRFDDGAGRTVSACRLFFLRAGASSTADIHDLCLLERSAVDLRELQRFATSGIETRQVQRAWPDAVVTSNRSHSRFYARLRSIFEIPDESALHLLHKTQSAKNLDSLDGLFRDYMLETPPTFALADTAVEQFGELRDAHARVVDLRRQRDHLVELREHADAYAVARDDVSRAERLIDAVGPYQRRRSLALARAEHEELTEQVQARTLGEQQAAGADLEARQALRRAERIALELGGSETELLQQRIAAAAQQAGDVRRRWEHFDADLCRAGVVGGAPQDAAGFAELMRAVEQVLAEPPPTALDHSTLHRLAQARAAVTGIEVEVEVIRRSGSTVPGALLEVREDLAGSLGLPAAALPFAAELLEVAPAHAAWAGAIERVLRPFALTLLVRSQHLAAVRRWVEDRTVRGRLVFEEVVLNPPAPIPAASSSSLVNRVTVAPGPFETWVSGTLSRRFDYACVDTADALEGHPRAVTMKGQVKTSATRYEKDDRRGIDDRTHWVLGDRDAKLDDLLEKLREARASAEVAERAAERLQEERSRADLRRAVFQSARTQRWSDVDHRAAEQSVRALEDDLRHLTQGNARLDDAVRAAEDARRAADEASTALQGARTDLELARRQLADVERFVLALTAEVSAGSVPEVPPDLEEQLAARFRSRRRHLTRDALGEVGQEVTRALSTELSQARDTAQTAGNHVVRAATAFTQTWPGAALNAQLVPTLEGRADYLELLDSILAQGLPEHEATFLRLLRERSRDLVGELVSDILAAPREVQDRVHPVNRSLRRSPFDEGRFLRLRVKTRRTQTVIRFLTDLRSVAEGSWTDDDLAAAEQRFTTLAALMQRLGSSDHADRTWRQQCLDTRLHVTFLAEEIDSHDHVHATYDSGAAMSGGQQQKLVVFCLAAALRYQLADPDARHPRYGVVVLDEAFDKADTRYTRMALDVFVEFGFQMVLATPQKLLQTIEPYVGAATSIENPTRRRSVTADVAWEERPQAGSR